MRRILFALSATALLSLTQAPAQPCPVRQISPPIPTTGTEGSSWFGNDVALRGDTLIVGEPLWNENDISRPDGRARVFRRVNDHWTYIGDVPRADDEPFGPGSFGYSVALSDERAVAADPFFGGVGSPPTGEAHILRRTGDDPADWTPEAVLTPSGLSDSGDLIAFGFACDIDAERIIVGAPRDDAGAVDSGAAYIFERRDGAWTQSARLAPPNPQTDSRFGEAVEIEGDVAVVSACDQSPAGAVYVYEFDTGADQWSLAAELTTPDEVDEPSLFGVSIDLRNALVAVGSAERSAGDRGAAYVYRKQGGAWTIMDAVRPTDTGANGSFSGVGLGDDFLLVSARASVSGGSVGALYFCDREGDRYIIVERIDSDDVGVSGGFGNAGPAVDGARAATGDFLGDGASPNSGVAYILEDENADGRPGGCSFLCIADATRDGVVNASDLSLLISSWGPQLRSPSDLDGNEFVNSRDLARLLPSWGPCD